MKKTVFFYSNLLLVFFCLQTFSQEKTIISPNNNHIQYMGRFNFSNTEKPRFAFPNTTIKAKFTGTYIELLLKNHLGTDFEENYFISIIDNGSPYKFQVTSSSENYLLADNLSNGEHTIELIKVTESYNGECEFLGFKLDANANLIEPDPLPELKIEFYGNSVTCGYGIADGDQPECDNSYLAYAAVTARELDAQFSTISYSGIGIVSGFAMFFMEDIYNQTIGTVDRYPFNTNNKWNFDLFKPNVIVVALGTNDYNTGLGFGSISEEEFKTGYRNLISKIRKEHSESIIICTNSPMVADELLGNCIAEVVSNTDDNKIYYFEFTLSEGNGLYGHPDTEDGKRNGEELAGFIQETLNNMAFSENQNTNNSVNIYPTLCNNQITVSCKSLIKTVSIINQEGKIIQKADTINQKTKQLNISGLNSGIYFVKAELTNGYSIQKIVKK